MCAPPRESVMTHELICAWLCLPAGKWPPDHYSLLGLQPGEADAARIEQQVHERLEAVRRHQLGHPDLATEAMNRLAQAFVCLTDAAAKKAYDAQLFNGRPAAEPAAGAGAEQIVAVNEPAAVVVPKPAAAGEELPPLVVAVQTSA